MYVFYVLCEFLLFDGLLDFPKTLGQELHKSAGRTASLQSSSQHWICTYSKDCLTFPVPAITLLWVPITPFFFHRWIFCSINPTDQVGFVNVLNFNTLGHLSLRPNPGSVSHQTSHFLIWFGSKVAQERAKGEQGVVVVVVMEWSWVEWVGGVGEWGGSAT